MWKVSADPQKFEEALEEFLKRTPMSEAQLKEVSERARERAFTLSGVASLTLVSEVYEEVVGVLKEGGDFAQVKVALLAKLNGEWGGSVKNPSARLNTVYRNAVQRAYNAGRYRQMREPAVLKARPYWMVDAVMDGATSDICAERDGITLSADDPWWQTNIPPYHHRCRTGIRTLTKKKAEKRGVSEAPKLEPLKGSFGLSPSDDEWQPSPSDYPSALWDLYQQKGAG